MKTLLAKLSQTTHWLYFTLILSIFLLLSHTTKLYATEFDHTYTKYDQLLKQVVQVSADKKQSRVRYQQLALKKTTLDNIVIVFSNISLNQYQAWQPAEKLSFLINAYNALTLKLIVNNWQEFTAGDADSIRDLGGLFTSPWKKKFFTLFSEKHNLDDLEHEMIRKWFKEPRIHAALVCAAVSCPPLRNEAFIADKLNQQLDNQMYLFLADSSRNEILLDDGQSKASLSSIFKWYREDFEKGDAEFSSLYDLLRKYNTAFMSGDDPQVIRRLLMGNDFPILFKDYDWRLNDVSNF